MSHLTEALLGWLIIMGMVFGGVGVFFFVASAIRSLVLLAQRVRTVASEAQEREPVDLYRGEPDNPAF